MGPVITAENLTIRFGDITAVDNVSFAVSRGEVFGFLGPNGSGKTTIIKALCGLLKVSSGSGSILGMDIRKESTAIKQHVGYMSQKFGLYEDLTVTENMNFYGGVYGLDDAALERRKKEVVELTSLAPYLDRRSGRLSGGWKQRLALACAILHSPEVVFLDEPTAGIDPVARRSLWDLLFRLSGEGVTFFVTTHYMDEAERCGRVGYIYLSKLIAIGSVDELKALPAANPEGTERVELECPNASVALAMVRKLAYVREATIFGRAIHILMDRAAGRGQLASDLEACGCGASSIRAVAPSLEDVFVTLTLQQEAQTK
ncbi:MAG: ABC transporter ATP-binding protein [Bryobacteraceae bacterium]